MSSTKKAKKKEILTFDKGWGEAHPRIQKFLQRVEDLDPDNKAPKNPPKVPPKEYTEVYHTIFEMCNQKDPHNLSHKLWKAYEDTLRTYFQDRVTKALKKANTNSQGQGRAILKAWAWRWQTATWVIKGMNRYFMFLDRYYAKSQDHLESLLRTGYKIYHAVIFEKFKQEIPGVLMNLIRDERNGLEISRETVAKAIESFVEIGGMIVSQDKDEQSKQRVYRDLFEERFLQETRQFYQTKTREWLNSSTPEYLRTAEKRIEEESNRQVSYIHNSSKLKTNQVIFEELLVQHQDTLLKKPTGLVKMFEMMHGTTRKMAEEDLARLYTLYLHVGDPGIDPIAKIMKDYISAQGKSYVKQAKTNEGGKGPSPEKQKQLIIDLLSLHTLFLSILKNQFGNHHILDRALRDGFKDFINQEEYVAVRLALYSHQILKKGGASNQQANTTTGETLDNIVKLYDYINDKDFFEINYQRFLADRLINDLSESFENEKAMIAKLKTVGGNAGWSKKLEEMFKDLQTSWDLMNDYKNKGGKDFPAIEFDCRVCTYGQWPSSNFDVVKIPKSIEPVTTSFKRFYEDRFSGRTLEYRLDQGKAEVTVPFKNGTKVFVVSPFQMSILLAFNEKNMWEHRDLQERTEIPEQSEDFERALLSLAHPKLKLLQKKPMTKSCKAGDMYRINGGFKHARRKITVPAFNMSLGKKKAVDDQQKMAIQKLREHQIDASIVRIMKTRKESKHAALIAEVIKQLSQRFAPKPTQIKKRIAILIDQEYLKRDTDDRTVYQYIA